MEDGWTERAGAANEEHSRAGIIGRADGRDLRCRDGGLKAVVPEREGLGSSSGVGGVKLAAGAE